MGTFSSLLWLISLINKAVAVFSVQDCCSQQPAGELELKCLQSEESQPLVLLDWTLPSATPELAVCQWLVLQTSCGLLWSQVYREWSNFESLPLSLTSSLTLRKCLDLFKCFSTAWNKIKFCFPLLLHLIWLYRPSLLRCFSKIFFYSFHSNSWKH